MMRMWLFSGTFFSWERFAAVAIPLIKLLPLTALNDMLAGRKASARTTFAAHELSEQ
jgi:hypothetical protein